MTVVSDVPQPVPYDPANPDAELPELPPGWRYEITVTAEADVIHADGTKN
jgi:hypothetical protein